MPTCAKSWRALRAIAMRLCNYTVLVADRKTNICERKVEAC